MVLWEEAAVDAWLPGFTPRQTLDPDDPLGLGFQLR